MSFAEMWAPALLEELEVKPDDPDYAAKLAAAEKSLTFTIAMIETYLDRKLEYLAAEVETFGPAPRSRLLLRRYPLETVAEIMIAGSAIPLDYATADDEAGVLYLNGWTAWPARVTYAGGYRDDAWPPALFMVVMELAASAYPGILAAGVPVLGAIEPAVKRISHPDVGTIEYSDGAGGSATIDVLGFGAIPAAYGAVLDRYRAASIIGGA